MTNHAQRPEIMNVDQDIIDLEEMTARCLGNLGNAFWAQPWLGQGKVLFGRQQLTSSGSQQFVDRSDLTEDEFVPSRSQGIALIGKSAEKKFEYNVGVYNDFSGRNASSNSDNRGPDDFWGASGQSESSLVSSCPTC